MLDRVLIKRFCELSGYGQDAIYKKCVNGVFTEGKEFFRAPDGHILVSISGFEKWSEDTKASHHAPKRQLKSVSHIRASTAEKPSTSNLQPLI